MEFVNFSALCLNYFELREEKLSFRKQTIKLVSETLKSVSQ